MILSKACEHAVRVVLHLATSTEKEYVPVRELAEACGVPYFYLAKICGQLAHAGILESHKGPRGGVLLAKPPREITLLDIVAAIDGLDKFSQCVLGLKACGEERPCPIHEQWASMKESIFQMLAQNDLQILADELNAGNAFVVQMSNDITS